MNGAPLPCSLRQLQYAVAVADLLSFRKAAELCHVSQPSLSAQVAQLERALEVKLFERDRRRVLVTLPGRSFLDRARVILRETEDLIEFAKSAGDPLSGSLRVGVIPTISPYLLPRLVPALRREYPRLHLQWSEGKTRTLVQELESGALDAALLALEADLHDLEREPIARDPFVLVASARDPLGAKRTPARLEELRQGSVLVLDDTHCLGDQTAAFCAGGNLRVHEFRGTSITTVAQMVAGGAGITLLPALAVPNETRSESLRVRPFAKPAPGRTIGLVWRKRSPFADAFRALAATIRRAYPKTEKLP